MTKKFYQILTYLLFAAFLVMFVAYMVTDTKNRKLKQEVGTMQHNTAHAITPLLRDTIRDSIPIIQQKVVVIDKTDYKQQVADRQLIKDLNLRIGQVESENHMLLATKNQVVFKTAADSDSILRYADRWCDFIYRTKQNTLDYSVRDSLTTIVSRQYKHKFLWWRWGTKGYQVHIVNHNPNGKIEYNSFIKVER